MQHAYAIMILYCLSIHAAKLSILLQIKNIFQGTQQLRKFVFWASWATIALVTCAYIFTLTLDVFSCTPVQKVRSLLPGPPHKAHTSHSFGTRLSLASVTERLQAMSPVPSTSSVILPSCYSPSLVFLSYACRCARKLQSRQSSVQA